MHTWTSTGLWVLLSLTVLLVWGVGAFVSIDGVFSGRADEFFGGVILQAFTIGFGALAYLIFGGE